MSAAGWLWVVGRGGRGLGAEMAVRGEALKRVDYTWLGVSQLAGGLAFSRLLDTQFPYSLPSGGEITYLFKRDRLNVK